MPTQTTNGNGKRRRQYRKHYVTSWGETIIGLMKRADGRFCPIGKSGVSFGSDERKAILRFRHWEARQRGEEPLTLSDLNADRILADLAEADRFIARFGVVDPEAFVTKLPNLRNVFRDYYRRLLVSNPRKAALALDDDRLDRLGELGDRSPSLTLEEIGDLYFNKRPPISPDWRRKAERFWREFRRIVTVETVREITPDDIARYHDRVLDMPLSATSVGHRFGNVKTTLEYALTCGKDQQQLQRVRTLCKMLVAPKKNKTNPQPISPEHFAALLDGADAKWSAVYLCALNFCMYPGEVAALKRSEIDLDAKTLVTDRSKTGQTRIAVIWDRTVAAIRKYQAERPHESEYLFVSQTGDAYTANHVGRNFRRQREAAGLPETVEFAHIRDGSYTSAIERGADLTHAKLLAGYAVGISDAYVRRNPRMVEDARAAIEAAYFGNDEKTRGERNVSSRRP